MHWLWAPAAFMLATLVGAQKVLTAAQQFEIDFVFPRNETYKSADIFPIVLAIQNYTIPRALGNFSVFWDIMPFSYGTVPGGIVYDEGYFHIPNTTATGDTAFLVAFTNATKWIFRRSRDERFVLQWQWQWTGLSKPCGFLDSIVGQNTPQDGALMFNVQVVGGRGHIDWQGEIHDVLDIPECPEFGASVEIGPGSNATKPECPSLGVSWGGQGNPCAVTVNKDAVSSIASQASSLASASIAATAEIITTTSSTSTAGVGPARPFQTALAAACVLCGLAL